MPILVASEYPFVLSVPAEGYRVSRRTRYEAWRPRFTSLIGSLCHVFIHQRAPDPALELGDWSMEVSERSLKQI